MQKGKRHLTLDQRGVIEHMLKEGASLRSIAASVGKHPTTISKEITGHLQVRQTGGWGNGLAVTESRSAATQTAKRNRRNAPNAKCAA